IESMLVGTPVIAFARGSAPEIVEDGVTGFLVRDARQMAARVADVGAIDRVRCRERARERWSSMRMARDYERIYEALARSKSGPPVRRNAETADPAYNQVDLMVSDLDHEEFLDDPQNFLHVRRRQMLDGGFIEEIVFTNFLMRVCNLEISIHFAADYADIFEV